MISYFGDKDESHNDRRAHKEPQAEHTGEDVEILCEGVRGDNDHSPQQAGDVDGRSDVEGIIQAFHFHFAGGESKDQGHDLQQSLVAIQQSQEDVSGPRLAHNDLVVSHHSKPLRENGGRKGEGKRKRTTSTGKTRKLLLPLQSVRDFPCSV